MLKQTITYIDFADNQRTDTLWFNLTRVEATDLLKIEDKLRLWAERTQGGQEGRELTNVEKLQLVDVIKELIKASYGERDEDGLRHRKSEKIYDDFISSAAYDAFLMHLLTDETGQRAVDFMIGIMPKELGEQARTEIANLPQTTGGEQRAVEEEVPAYMRENRPATKAELMQMSDAQMQQAFLFRQQLGQKQEKVDAGDTSGMTLAE